MRSTNSATDRFTSRSATEQSSPAPFPWSRVSPNPLLLALTLLGIGPVPLARLPRPTVVTASVPTIGAPPYPGELRDRLRLSAFGARPLNARAPVPAVATACTKKVEIAPTEVETLQEA